jgi:hypothetical protein
LPHRDDIDLARLTVGIQDVGTRYRTTFDSLVGKRSTLLEYAALMLAVERYAVAGYAVAAAGLTPAGRFKVKTSSNGYPWNFSWYEVTRDARTFELLTNGKTFGAYPDGGTYVVDVAVLVSGSLAAAKSQGRGFPGFRNRDLRTFIESKALTVYPMLLAQFVGIVLEIKPTFVGGRRPRFHVAQDHFDPAMVALGSFSANADAIVDHYPDRSYRINVVPRFDAEVARGDLSDVARGLEPEIL